MRRQEFLELIGLGAAATTVRPHIKGKMQFFQSFGKSDMLIGFDRGAIVSLKKKNDKFNTDYILDNQRFGDILVRYRYDNGKWLELSTAEKAKAGQLSVQKGIDKGFYQVSFHSSELELALNYKAVNNRLEWFISLKNKTEKAIEIGDVAIPFPMNSDWSWKRKVTYNQRVIRHSFVSGHNSYAFWARCNAIGPYLLMTPKGDTHLEYYSQRDNAGSHKLPFYTAYIHSFAQKEYIAKKNGNWRQENTSIILPVAGQPGSKWEAGFQFQWVKDYDDIRKALHDNGLFNIYVKPGMTVPFGMKVWIGLEGLHDIQKIVPEFESKTTIRKSTSGKGREAQLFDVLFNQLGENKLTVYYGGDRYFVLEFFITEPIETLLNKRGKYITDRLQIRDKTKWYDGLLSDWNMEDQTLLSPDDLDTIPESRRYMVTCDDPGFSRPAFLASKNVEYPVQEEVTALEYYLRNFVWGGLQMTDDETYPGAIYGIPDWKTNRDSDDLGSKGQSHVWRVYDYPHIVLMYLSLFRIARFHSSIKTEYSWETYLLHAYRTAIAYYTFPLEIIDWSPYQTGNYNEISIVELISELEAAGWELKAFRLRKHWEKKAAYFLNGKANMFGSEYPYDTTGFESTQVIARYAMDHAGEENKEMPLKVSRDEAWAFMQKQIELNVGCRGWLEKAYYLYGSDYRGSGNARYLLSYMAQMGGWAILDYVLYFAENPFYYLRLAYASVLSSWALMNTGTRDSNYGYWYSGKLNDGGAGGGFEPLAHTETWLGQKQNRGSWYYGCEIDLGYCGFLRAACTILADDPVFGLTVYGGSLKRTVESVQVFPEDGLRRRFHLLKNDLRFHLEIVRYDKFLRNKPIVISENLGRIQFYLENIDHKNHDVKLKLVGLPKANYHLLVDGIKRNSFEGIENHPIELEFSISSSRSHKVVIKRKSTR